MEICGFELAKKLKEKGFNYPCIGHYVNNQLYVAHYQNAFHSDNNESVDAPTISQVLRWLREEKKIHIMIDLWPAGYDAMIYIGISKKNNHFDWEGLYNGLDICETYELAALAGIEYVIDNLI